MTKPTCATCRFFDIFPNEREHYQESSWLESECLRHSPIVPLVILTNRPSTIAGAFPSVKSNYWCGDYEEFKP